jgi:hypothetical protein
MAKNTLQKKHPKTNLVVRGPYQKGWDASKSLKRSGKAAPSNAPQK